MTCSVYNSFRIIAPRGGCPKATGLLMIVLWKIVPEESYPQQQFPRMVAHWMIAHKDSCSRGYLSHPRTVASEENRFPPVQSLSKKISFEKNSRTIATMDAYFRTILLEENSLEGNCLQRIQSLKIIPSNEYYELTRVQHVLLRGLRF